MTLPIEPTEPLCFCDVDGCFQIGAGGANIAVGDGAAWFKLKAPFVSSGDLRGTWLVRHVRSRNAVMSGADRGISGYGTICGRVRSPVLAPLSFSS
jgi:hypothetical protein